MTGIPCDISTSVQSPTHPDVKEDKRAPQPALAQDGYRLHDQDMACRYNGQRCDHDRSACHRSPAPDQAVTMCSNIVASTGLGAGPAAMPHCRRRLPIAYERLLKSANVAFCPSGFDLLLYSTGEYDPDGRQASAITPKKRITSGSMKMATATLACRGIRSGFQSRAAY